MMLSFETNCNCFHFSCKWLLLLPFFGFLISCSQQQNTLFRLLPPERTGIDFQNDIIEDEYLNILSNEYIYNGAGVGVGDFNKDKLPDLFFCGSQTTNRLYLNEGNFRFKDISLPARVVGRGYWSTGVSVVDINEDGWLDIYVCASNHLNPEMRRNQLYIHEGLNHDGIPVFSEQALRFGIADEGYSTHAAFFDYDNDKDLDLYVLTNYLDTEKPNAYRPKKLDGTAPSNDRLYRNDGHNHFTNVTVEAGITYEGYGLGVSIADFNMDGWSDIYITNDYLTNDLMYINQKNGTFENHISKYIKHQTHSGMGHDVADINNDGLVDIFTLDMLPEDNQGMKKMHGVTRFENEELNRFFGYQQQYKRNMLHVNNGPDASGNHQFSEVGLYAGVFATEWSWTALFADYDNDGFRDLFVSNGYPRDVTDLDYAVSGMSRGRGLSNEEAMTIIPVRSMSNYMFRNNGDLTFTNTTVDWGLGKPSFSNGAVFVDLDGDGDLEIVTSNYNEPAMVYENTLLDGSRADNKHYVRLRFNVPAHQQIGTKAYIFHRNGMAYADYNFFRGYRSSVESVLHFGLGEVQTVDSILIIWHDGTMQKLRDIAADQLLEIDYQPIGTFQGSFGRLHEGANLLFVEVTDVLGLEYFHREKSFDDYQLQETLPHQYTHNGPPVATGDVNGDGYTDLFIGASMNQSGVLFIQKKDGFESQRLGDEHRDYEDTDALFFDADGDGDLDLYFVSGSQEAGMKLQNYQDRLYLNDGQGAFQDYPNALPSMPVSGSCVRAHDFDADGDLDLFVGGRLIPGTYPKAASSYLLRNDSHSGEPVFSDVTAQICPELQDVGLTADAIWMDFSNDKVADLLIVGEWMPVMFFQNMEGKLENVTSTTGINDRLGWWRSIASGDFDSDGDIDFVLGNEGLNSWFQAGRQEPIVAYHSDFDNNGRYDLIITQFLLSNDGYRTAFPVHFKSDLGKQLESVNQKFSSYEAYSRATISDLLSRNEIENVQVNEANWLANSYIENLGSNRFSIRELPPMAQLAPINDMLVEDFNSDGNLDMLVVGNNFANSVFWGPMDALNGLVLLGDGHGNFNGLDYPKTGFFVPGDAQHLEKLPLADGRQLFLVSQNRDSLKTFEIFRPIVPNR
jgi:hypothetical protein